MPLEPKRDPQTVTPAGERTAPMIDGVKIRPAVTQVDERGTITEILDPAWHFLDAPIVYVYEMTIQPRRVKGWVKHHDQEDRMFLRHGRVKIVLYDDRPESKTYQLISVICLSEHNRSLISFPCQVFHAIQNIGETEACMINMPTRPYNHAKPDKFRLPLNNDKIPYKFDPYAIGG